MDSHMVFPFVFYSATDPSYRGYKVWFENVNHAAAWREGVIKQYGSAPNLTEHLLEDVDGMVDFLNQEYHFEEQ